MLFMFYDLEKFNQVSDSGEEAVVICVSEHIHLINLTFSLGREDLACQYHVIIE